MNELDFLKRIITLFHEDTDSIFWFPQDDGNIKVCVNANDLFMWACANAEEITIADMPELEKAIKDCNDDAGIGALLYACRKRKCRPLKPYYEHLPTNLRSLFSEVGDGT